MDGQRPRLGGSKLCCLELRRPARPSTPADGAKLGDRPDRRKTAGRIHPATRWLLGIAGTSRRAAKSLSQTTRRPPWKGRCQKYRLLMERRHTAGILIFAAEPI